MNKLAFFGLLVLAASITYLAVEIKGVSDSLEAVEPHIPRLLEESKAYRMLVPGVVQEVAAVREQTGRMIPDILARVDRIEQQIHPILKESAALRLQVSAVVDESRAIRETAPDIVDLFCREDGTIWVQTSRAQWEPPEGAFTVYDVFDDSGTFLRQETVFCDGDPTRDRLVFIDEEYVFKIPNWVLYRDEDSDQIPPPLSCYKIVGP